LIKKINKADNAIFKLAHDYEQLFRQKKQPETLMADIQNKNDSDVSNGSFLSSANSRKKSDFEEEFELL